MNNPAVLNLDQQWVTLDSEPNPTLLVYGESLAKALLSSDQIKSYNLIVYWKLVAKIAQEPLPAIETLFANTPMFLHGQAHTESRKRLIPLYKSVESQLGSWLPEVCDEFFNRLEANREVNTLDAVEEFLDLLAKRIFAKSLGCRPQDLKSFPRTIFQMLARAGNLQEFEQRLQALAEHAKEIIRESGGDSESVWALASISVMGREPLRGALLHGLINAPPEGSVWRAEELLHSSAPVSILGREVVRNCSIQDLSLASGQLIHICPFLLHLRNAHREPENPNAGGVRERTSFSFGFGPHVCPGRKISIAVVREFFRQVAARPHLNFQKTRIKLVRDFTLTYSRQTAGNPRSEERHE